MRQSEDSLISSTERFDRVWTVQEFVLGKKVRFQIGAQELEDDMVKTALDVLLKTRDYSTTESVIRNTDRLSFVSGLFRVRKLYRETKEQGNGTGSPFSLAGCVSSLARRRVCSNERDRVYGVLAIAQNDMITPDYSTPMRDLYFEVARQSLRHGELILLHDYNMDDRISNAHFLISTLEPLTTKYLPIWRLPSYAPYKASGDTAAPCLADHNGQLTLQGFVLDTIFTKYRQLDCTNQPLDWCRTERTQTTTFDIIVSSGWNSVNYANILKGL